MFDWKPVMAGAFLAIGAAQGHAQDLPIAVQMFTLREFGTLEEQLAAVQEAGITAIETVGTQKVSAEELKGLMEEYGVEAISTHAALESLRTDLDGVIEFNKAIGNTHITVPNLPVEIRPTNEAEWTALGQELGQISDRLGEESMTLVYHNHDYEIVELSDGRTALEVILDIAGPEVQSELDLAWIARAGYDPVEYIGRFDGRVFAIHAKDNAPEGEAEDEKGFAAVGAGVMDWEGILAAAEDAGTSWYIIEHDQPKDAPATIQAGATYLTEHLTKTSAN